MLVYCIHNTVNGKSYVGQTCQKIVARWRSHVAEALKRNSQRYLCRAIRKYSAQAFEVFELAQATSLEQLNTLEQLWVWALQSANAEFGYNRTGGGDSGLNEAARKQMAETKRGRKMSEEQKEKIRQAVTGTHWTEESRAAWKGHKKSNEMRSKLSAQRLGKTLSEEHKCALRKPHKVSDALLAHIAEIAIKRKGSRDTEETLKKKSLWQKGKKKKPLSLETRERLRQTSTASWARRKGLL